MAQGKKPVYIAENWDVRGKHRFEDRAQQKLVGPCRSSVGSGLILQVQGAALKVLQMLTSR